MARRSSPGLLVLLVVLAAIDKSGVAVASVAVGFDVMVVVVLGVKRDDQNANRRC